MSPKLWDIQPPSLSSPVAMPVATRDTACTMLLIICSCCL
jgi:hypothetical protein